MRVIIKGRMPAMYRRPGWVHLAVKSYDGILGDPSSTTKH
jgi:hypothetical protein